MVRRQIKSGNEIKEVERVVLNTFSDFFPNRKDLIKGYERGFNSSYNSTRFHMTNEISMGGTIKRCWEVSEDLTGVRYGLPAK